MRYEQLTPIDRLEVEQTLASDQPEAINRVLVAVALYDDWRYAEAQCLSLLRYPDLSVKMTAVLCLGHIARLHGRLHLDLVQPLLDALYATAEPALRGRIEDARSDIDAYI